MENYEAIESRLFIAVGQFEDRWNKAWHAWVKTRDIPTDMAADIGGNCPYDEDGKLLPEAKEWHEIYTIVKTTVEEEFNAKILIDIDGMVSARHTCPDGDTITVP